MAGARDNHRLREVIAVQEGPDLVRCLIAIHDRHREVHEYETVVLVGSRLFAHGCSELYFLESLLAVDGGVDDLFYSARADAAKLELQAHDIEDFIVNYQDSCLVILHKIQERYLRAWFRLVGLLINELMNFQMLHLFLILV